MHETKATAKQLEKQSKTAIMPSAVSTRSSLLGNKKYLLNLFKISGSIFYSATLLMAYKYHADKLFINFSFGHFYAHIWNNKTVRRYAISKVSTATV